MIRTPAGPSGRGLWRARCDRGSRYRARTRGTEVIQTLGQHPHQFALALHVVEEEQEHQLEDHFRISGDVAVVAITMRHFLPHETEVDPRADRAQGMISTNTPIQIHLITEHLFLPVVESHHIAEDRRGSLRGVQSSRRFGQHAHKA